MEKWQVQEKLKEISKAVVSDTGLQPHEFYIAGGCIRSMLIGEDVEDIDIFLNNSDKVEELKSKYYTVSENAITFSLDVDVTSFWSTGYKAQIIIASVGNPESIINDFDFTMNHNYYDPFHDVLVVKDLTSIITKQLKINANCRNKVGTLARIEKFIKRGYNCPSRIDLINLAVQISQEGSITKYSEVANKSRLYLSEDEYSGLVGIEFDQPRRNFRGSGV